MTRAMQSRSRPEPAPGKLPQDARPLKANPMKASRERRENAPDGRYAAIQDPDTRQLDAGILPCKPQRLVKKRFRQTFKMLQITLSDPL
jgi:hypothetical protein